ncbi:gustatory receptor for bitter taste 66a-like [Vanessa cardui]|uniref:gustatory receptor for bitter taste 66a-like n=1 Tax=Vanessa cardui TaxID=171605 RepID=UPI001F12ECD4|nr:gustatory receptor for bitter taste 66a-like [Vanessa cardui]
MDLTKIHNECGPLATVLRISSVLGLVPLRLSPVNNQCIRVLPLQVQRDYSRRSGYSACLSYKRAIFGYVLVSVLSSKKTKTMTSAPNAHLHNRQSVILIQRLCCANVSICEVVRSIDEGEGALVAALLLSLIISCMDSYHIIIKILYTSLDEWSYDKTFKFALFIVLALYEVVQIIFMAEPCHRTQEEFEAARILVSQLMCAPAEKEFRDELSHYSNHFVENPPAFSPLGLFVLGRQFVIAVIGGIVTFLVIILQFNLTDTINLQSL